MNTVFKILMVGFKSQRNTKRKEEIFFPHQIYITWKYIFILFPGKSIVFFLAARDWLSGAEF